MNVGCVNGNELAEKEVHSKIMTDSSEDFKVKRYTGPSFSLKSLPTSVSSMGQT